MPTASQHSHICATPSFADFPIHSAPPDQPSGRKTFYRTVSSEAVVASSSPPDFEGVQTALESFVVVGRSDIEPISFQGQTVNKRLDTPRPSPAVHVDLPRSSQSSSSLSGSNDPASDSVSPPSSPVVLPSHDYRARYGSLAYKVNSLRLLEIKDFLDLFKEGQRNCICCFVSDRQDWRGHMAVPGLCPLDTDYQQLQRFKDLWRRLYFDERVETCKACGIPLKRVSSQRVLHFRPLRIFLTHPQAYFTPPPDRPDIEVSKQGKDKWARLHDSYLDHCRQKLTIIPMLFTFTQDEQLVQQFVQSDFNSLGAPVWLNLYDMNNLKTLYIDKEDNMPHMLSVVEFLLARTSLQWRT